MSFDWNASFEWFAERFRQETGMMAPGKDDAMPSDMNERRKAWNEWMGIRSDQAWREWHERHGMLAASAAPAEGLPHYRAKDSGSGCARCGYPLIQHVGGRLCPHGVMPAEGREAVDERAAWQTGEPPVKHGDADEFIVACRRAHNPSKIFVFSAHYANAYVDDNEDDEAKPRTGWFMHGMDMSGEYAYVYENICDNGDKIIAWQSLPKWGDEARAALATASTLPDEPLTCDFCGAPTDDPWHTSDTKRKHLHQCDACHALATSPTKYDPVRNAVFEAVTNWVTENHISFDPQCNLFKALSKAFGKPSTAPTLSEGSPILLTVLLNLVNADTILANSASFTDRCAAQALLRKALDDAREILGIDRANAEGEKS
jgi:hypothetical protein